MLKNLLDGVILATNLSRYTHICRPSFCSIMCNIFKSHFFFCQIQSFHCQRDKRKETFGQFGPTIMRPINCHGLARIPYPIVELNDRIYMNINLLGPATFLSRTGILRIKILQSLMSNSEKIYFGLSSHSRSFPHKCLTMPATNVFVFFF
jgi:hypothetical protein